ncbi:hypothetical protein EHV23_12065 [Lautropia dentalis]|uniref:Wadjet protein JetD C-terminal domain-containing protein n=1 Tax=Lautropia dentalis TaxID=2490857 RepID=A0A426FN55_9BURK|nr:hypothetical protein [Lautropia dentalis]RRN44105.1 hypothetical protein EHV23_12065 [Lautropia dentalis]
MSKHENALRTALLRLNGQNPLPVSAFTPAQRRALERFGQQTGAVQFLARGSGGSYRISNPTVFALHLRTLSPEAFVSPCQASQDAEPASHDAGPASHGADLPSRAHNIGHRRDSKAGRHAHDAGYVLLKATGPLDWHAPTRDLHLPLAAHTRDFGAACLRITPDDDWHTGAPLWLIENQALFDRTDWLPPGPAVTLLYYNGQLSDLLVRWLAARPRGSRLIHFPDYDGIGLANFARLHAQLGDACHFWLMPGWADSLQRYGSHALWLRTLDPFLRVRPDLPSHLAPLLTQMELNGLALEQEAVWLTA